MTLNDLFSLIVKNLKFFIIAPIIGGLIAFGYTYFFVQETYSAAGNVYVRSEEELGTLNEFNKSDQLVNDLVIIYKKASMREAASKSSAIPLDVFRKATFTVTKNTGSRIIDVKVTTNDAETAALITNAFLDECVTQGMAVTDAKAINIVDRAKVPTSKSGPNLTNNIMLGVVLALVITFIILFVGKLLDYTIKTRDDVKKHLDIPILATFYTLDD